MKTIRVILADDHTLVRAGIRALLEKMPAVEVVGEASDGREVLHLVKAQTPDVVLMDIGMPGLNGLEATTRLVREFPRVRVIILSMYQTDEYVWRALKVGASAYLLKKSAVAELQMALQRVVRNEIYLSRDISKRLRKEFPLHEITEVKGPLEKLNERQREVLQLIAEGQNTKEIAGILKVSPKTIEYHRKKLMDAVNVYDIPGLVRLALRTGLVMHEG
jgi:DNA-binding NarL/FixJ family response regulator